MNQFANKSLSLNSRVRHRMVGDEGVIVCMHNGNVIIVNEVGAFIVDQLNNPISFANLATEISNYFEVSADQASHDLNDYLSELKLQDVLINTDSQADKSNVINSNV